MALFLCNSIILRKFWLLYFRWLKFSNDQSKTCIWLFSFFYSCKISYLILSRLPNLILSPFPLCGEILCLLHQLSKLLLKFHENNIAYYKITFDYLVPLRCFIPYEHKTITAFSMSRRWLPKRTLRCLIQGWESSQEIYKRRMS